MEKSLNISLKKVIGVSWVMGDQTVLDLLPLPPQGMVLGHDGQLKSLMEAASGRPIPGSRASVLLEEILDAKLAGVRADILDGFERRLTGLESHCDERIVAVQRQCQREHVDGQEQMQQSLDGRETGIREELGTLQAQIQGLTLTESCCGQVAYHAQVHRLNTCTHF